MTSRHDLVWLTPAAWGESPALAPWRAHDWPAVVRRHEPGVDAGAICLGVPLPGRGRHALVVAPADVTRTTPPRLLADAIGAAPSAWLAGLQQLARAAGTLELRVVGSLAMASLTGLPYVSATSDIDLLLYPATQRDLHTGVALLEEYAQRLPLDGEIVFPQGDAVAWKEWQEWQTARGTGARVLVKSLHGVRLAEPAALLASLAP